jgi:hypothetical protein
LVAARSAPSLVCHSQQKFFDTPQQEVATTLTGTAAHVGGWGAATFQAFDAIGTLLAAGVTADRLFLHLGLTRPK